MPIDEFAGLPSEDAYETDIEDLSLQDYTELNDNQLLEQALIAEEAMLLNKKGQIQRITRSITKSTFSIINSKILKPISPRLITLYHQ